MEISNDTYATIRMPRILLDQLKTVAVQKGTTVSDLLRRAALDEVLSAGVETRG